MREKFLLELRAAKFIAPNVKHFTFEVKNKDFSFAAGQFISLHMINAQGEEVRRNYSIASPPTDPTVIEMACSYVKGGLASEKLFNQLKEGDQLEASGPYGIFVLKPNDPQRYVLVSTGTGVTPYRSMLP